MSLPARHVVLASKAHPPVATIQTLGGVKRSLWGGSYIGVIGIDRTSGSSTDSYNEAAGADTLLVVWRDLVVRAYAAQTRSPGVSSGQTNGGVGLNYRQCLA